MRAVIVMLLDCLALYFQCIGVATFVFKGFKEAAVWIIIDILSPNIV